MKTLCFLIALLAAAAPHGELEDQIRELDARIAAEPARLELRLRRGELLRLHGASLRALADFDAVLLRDPGHPSARFFKALAFRDMKRFAGARRELDRHLARGPREAAALRLSARLGVEMSDFHRACADWRELFDLDDAVSPDDALAWMKAARASAGDDDRLGWSRALGVLERALARLGPAIVIEIEAARCEARLGRLEDLDRRFARLTAGLKKKDWFDRARRAILAEVEEGNDR